MFQFLRKYDKWILVVGGTLLMITFLVPQAIQGLAEYSASQIKKAVVGSGRASKEQVRHMVGILLKMDASQQELDCTDALAVALCHAHSAPLAARTGMPAGARWTRRSQRSKR